MATSTPRASALRRLGIFCHRRHWLVTGIWVLAIVVLFGIASAAGQAYSAGFGDFNSEATQGFELLEEHYGGAAGGDQGSIVFVADEGIDDPGTRAAIEGLLDQVAAIDGVEVVGPYENPLQVSPQGPLAGQLAYATVLFSPEQYENFSDIQAVGEDLREMLPPVEASGVRVELGGEVFAEFEPPEAEILGLGFAIVILIVAFGSVLAMGLPIGMAVAGIGAGVLLVGLVAHAVPMPDFTMTLAAMLGIGVGIDYALFIVTRFREDLHRGMEAEDAAGHALDTAGRAVLFAGTTVVISVLGMLVMGLGFIRGIGVGAAVAVACTMVASVTLLPALLGFAGDRLEVTRWRGLIAAGLVAVSLVGIGVGLPPLAAGIPVALVVLLVGTFVPALKKPLPPRRHRAVRETFFYRYSRFVQRRPWTGLLAGVAILGVLALPVLGLRLGFSDEGNYPEGTTTREAYDLLATGFGPGFNGPLLLVTEMPNGTDQATLDRVTSAVQSTEGVVFASPADLAPDGSAARWFVVPSTAPQDSATVDLVHTLREDVLEDAAAGSELDVLVSSWTALSIDFTSYLSGRYPWFFAAILGLSFLLLMAVFRSLLVPVKAVIMNLLSIGAAYGVVVAIFQWGWLSGLTGLTPAPIEPFMPMMLFAIVFGLSMDYEVFLLSRMKEEYDRTGDNANAVADGLAVTARVITAAALIMVVVFGSFVLEPNRIVKLMGTGLALAILLDASVVRMLLVPSTMELLGDRNWWLPRWLDRLLPAIHIEAPAEDVAEADPVEEEGDEPDPELVGAT